MPISKDEHYAIYNLGVEDGRKLIHNSRYAGDDILEIATRKLSDRDARRIQKSQLDDLVMLVKNYMDGLEDGVKAGVIRESSNYVKWLKEES